MVVLVTTLGYTAPLSLAPLRDQKFEEVHLIYGLPLKPEGEAALEAARTTLATLGVPLKEHGVQDAFDYVGVVGALANAFAAANGREVIVNGSGGTRPMIMATAVFALLYPVKLVYYDEYETTRGKEIPIRAILGLRDLGESQQGIIEILRRAPADMGTLADEMGLAPSTLSAHVQRLHEAGIVNVEKRGKHRIVSLLPGLEGIEAGGT